MQPMIGPLGEIRSDTVVPKTLKIFGERNSGTNYLEQLVAQNLKIPRLLGGGPKVLQRHLQTSERARDWYFWLTRSRNLGWKHALPPTERQLSRMRRNFDDVIFLTVTKNPYSWLLSLYRRPYHSKRSYSSFEEFLSEPWATLGRENAPNAFSSPVEMWNQKTARYRALAEYTTSLACRYEDLLVDPLKVLERLSSEFGIAARKHPFKNVEKATKRMDRGKTFDDYRAYYLEERWRDELDSNCRRLINDQLDFELVNHHSYERVE